MAEGFLATDAILNIMLNVTDGLVVYPKVVRSRLMAELPFMASENIMMQAVEKGGNRQELHERLRQHAIAAGKDVYKRQGVVGAAVSNTQVKRSGCWVPQPGQWHGVSRDGEV